MRLVLDTNVVVSAMRSPAGASAEVIRLAVRKRVTLLGTLALALEYIEVSTRRSTLQGTNISSADAERFANQVIALLDPVEIRFDWRPLAPDPDDDLVMMAALNGAADAVVTFNLRDFLAPAHAFGLQVMTPAHILMKVGENRE